MDERVRRISKQIVAAEELKRRTVVWMASFKILPWMSGGQRIGKQIVAAEELKRKTVVWMASLGQASDIPSPIRTIAGTHTIQVGKGMHLDISVSSPGGEFTQHSCDPNARLVLDEDRKRLSLETLKVVPGAETLTFDYNTSELKMSSPFECVCGAPGCVGTIKGFSSLNKDQQEHIRHLLLPHVLAMAS
eukprot:CAMPEP_0194284118 /NCGR_PEP_ID=MMETSP0169-20130528/26785_1 /TAXON_ID=218684 /ORGANISM="Corethron pennatum, Strain L29A3" /LENGTH=189 /DNA_ID=CAMNT_0039029851 /DNA_START=38 /DNA_END=607 /DNA_ORIENTATION=-